MMWLRITGALRALLCLAVGGWLLRDRRPWPATSAWHPWPGRKRKGMVVATLVIAALLGIYLLISPNHLRRSVHLRDTYHYYLGAKYFTELGYRGLYDCSLAADIEAGLGGDLSSRLIRNLETNKMELPQESRCRGWWRAAPRSEVRPMGACAPGCIFVCAK